MGYESINLKQDIVIDQLVSVHYFEYMSDFSFEGETHDFWEFLCVDKGTVNVMAGDTPYTLNKGDVIFHMPNEFHNVTSNGVIAPNLVVISFYCDSPIMKFFEKKILQIGTLERELLGRIIKESLSVFSCRLDNPYSQKLIKKNENEIPFGSEQLIKSYLEQFLIQLIRLHTKNEAAPVLPKSTKQKNELNIYHRVLEYMEENLNKQLTIDVICQDNLIGRSILQRIFHEQSHCGVIDYFLLMKINAAKQMIRNGHMNFTQIADNLGYTSIHYFSRQFKKITGMSPSEYASSIKLLSEKPEDNSTP